MQYFLLFIIKYASYDIWEKISTICETITWEKRRKRKCSRKDTLLICLQKSFIPNHWILLIKEKLIKYKKKSSASHTRKILKNVILVMKDFHERLLFFFVQKSLVWHWSGTCRPNESQYKILYFMDNN